MIDDRFYNDNAVIIVTKAVPKKRSYKIITFVLFLVYFSENMSLCVQICVSVLQSDCVHIPICVYYVYPCVRVRDACVSV